MHGSALIYGDVVQKFAVRKHRAQDLQDALAVPIAVFLASMRGVPRGEAFHNECEARLLKCHAGRTRSL